MVSELSSLKALEVFRDIQAEAPSKNASTSTSSGVSPKPSLPNPPRQPPTISNRAEALRTSKAEAENVERTKQLQAKAAQLEAQQLEEGELDATKLEAESGEVDVEVEAEPVDVGLMIPTAKANAIYKRSAQAAATATATSDASVVAAPDTDNDVKHSRPKGFLPPWVKDKMDKDKSSHRHDDSASARGGWGKGSWNDYESEQWWGKTDRSWSSTDVAWTKSKGKGDKAEKPKGPYEQWTKKICGKGADWIETVITRPLEHY